MNQILIQKQENNNNECPNCKGYIEDTFNFCNWCGIKLTVNGAWKVDKNEIKKLIQYWYIESIIEDHSFFIVYDRIKDNLRVFKFEDIPKNTKQTITINKRFLLDQIIDRTIEYINGAWIDAIL